MKFSRRSFLHTGVAAVSLASAGGAQAGLRFRSQIGGAPPFDPPVVSPYSTWNGAENSGYVANVLGGVVPSNAAPGTNGQPVAKWKQANELIFFQDRIVGVDADTSGGPGNIASVKFYGDIATTVLNGAQWSIYTKTDQRGLTSKRRGYWIKLSYAAFAAISTASSSAIRIYCDVTSTDGQMTTRTIGRNVTNADNSVSDCEMRLYPRPTEFDHTYAIGPSQPTLKTLALAISQARTDAAERPCFNLAETGFYNLTDVTAGGSTANAKGRGVITCPAGVTATLGMSTAYDPNDPTLWEWRSGWVSLEFRNNGQSGNQGLILDLLNWCRLDITGSDRFKHASLWNGCRLTNSVVNDPAKDWMGYWNGGSKPANLNNRNYTFGTFTSGNITAWDHFYDGISEYFVIAPFQFRAYVVSGWKDRLSIDNLFQVQTWAENCYFFQNSINPQRNTNRGISAVTIQGPAGSTIHFAPLYLGAGNTLNNATISGTTLTTTNTTAVIQPGTLLSEGGVLAGTYVVSGSAGTFTVSQSQTISTPVSIIVNGCLDNEHSGSVYVAISGVMQGTPLCLGKLPNLGGCLISDFAAWFNGLGAGFSATVLNDKLLGARFISYLENGTVSPTSVNGVDVSISSPATLNVAKLTHSDFIISGGISNNAIWRNLIVHDGYWNTALLDSPRVDGMSIRNFLGCCQGLGARNYGSLSGNANGFASQMTNFAIDHCWFDSCTDVYTHQDTQTLVEFWGNIAQSLSATNSTTLNNPPFNCNGNLYATKNSKPFQVGSPVNVFLSPTIAPNAPNPSITNGGPTNLPAAYYAMYVNSSGGASADFTVSPTSVLLSNMIPVTSGNEYDVYYNLRGKLTPGYDVPGPVAAGYTAPPPFDFANG